MTACPLNLISFRGEIVAYEAANGDYSAWLLYGGDTLAMTDELRRAIHDDTQKQAAKLNHAASDA